MELFYRKMGYGPTVIILHGLYGSSDNWISIAKELAKNYEVYVLDMRNHGRSFHSPYHSYELMQEDIFQFMNTHNLNNATIIGHSMGGKAAMFFAKQHPEMIDNLVVIDISPFSYGEQTHSLHISLHEKIISSLLSVNLKNIDSRESTYNFLIPIFENPSLVNFLLKNLTRNDNQDFIWKLNLQAIKKSLPTLLDGFEEKSDDYPITGFPILFLKGGLSTYLKTKDIDKIKKVFPMAEFKTIEMTGHWLHAEKPNETISAISSFLQ